MLSYKVSTSKTESGMILAELNQVLVVLKHLRIFLQVVPVKMVDAVGRLKGIMNTFLIAQHFLAAEHEGNALRSEHSSLCKQVEPDDFVG